jgi:hypothetical protein
VFRRKADILPAFLFAIIPVVRLLVDGALPVSMPIVLSRQLLLLVATGLLLVGLKSIISQVPQRVALVCFVSFVFFNYFRVYLFFVHLPILNGLADGELVAQLAIAGCVVIAAVFLRKVKTPFSAFTILPTMLAIVMLTSSVLQAGALMWLSRGRSWTAVADELILKNMQYPIQPSANPPDIYYIVLDGYARADVLKRLYRYDNSAFVDYLVSRGFYVPEFSRSNYPQTYLSLASSLNWTYLDDIASSMGEAAKDRSPLRYLIEKSSASVLLSKAGYRVVLLPPEYWSEDGGLGVDAIELGSFGIRPFDAALLDATPLSLWLSTYRYHVHRDNILRTFDRLGEPPSKDSPVFVFAHIIAPHPPFVFDSDGEPLEPRSPFAINDGSQFMGTHEEYLTGYVDQLAYVNTRVMRMVEELLAHSSTPPVIIIQGDHGPASMLDWENVSRTDMQERMGILAAYYVPPEVRAQLYDTITPVNSFRIILNGILHTKYDILPDRSYFATWSHPYQFIRVSSDSPTSQAAR